MEATMFNQENMNNYKKMELKQMVALLEGSEALGIESPVIVDRRVDTRLLKAEPEGKTIVLNVPETGTFPLNAWAHSQLAEKTGIPRGYYDRMHTAGESQLLSDNVNKWLPEKDQRMIRIKDGTIRAIVSDRYKIIDNINVLRCLMEELAVNYRTLEPKFHECWLGDTRMYLKVALMGLEGEPKPGDKYHFGLIASNSEVGAGMLKLEPYALRQVCTNGMVRMSLLKRIHIGSANTDIHISAETRLLQDSAVYSEFRDAVHTMLDGGGAGFAKWMNDLELSSQVVIDKPTDAIAQVVGRFKISEANAKLVENYFLKEEDCTQYGLIQGITRAAQDVTDLDEAIRMEAIAGDISEMGDKEFRKMIKVVA